MTGDTSVLLGVKGLRRSPEELVRGGAAVSYNKIEISETGDTSVLLVKGLRRSPEELVWGGAAVHETVGDDGGGVADGGPHAVLGVPEDEEVAVVVADEVLQVQVDGRLAAQDQGQPLHPPLVRLLGRTLKKQRVVEFFLLCVWSLGTNSTFKLDVDPRRDDDASPKLSYRCLLRPTWMISSLWHKSKYKSKFNFELFFFTQKNTIQKKVFFYHYSPDLLFSSGPPLPPQGDWQPSSPPP